MYTILLSALSFTCFKTKTITCHHYTNAGTKKDASKLYEKEMDKPKFVLNAILLVFSRGRQSGRGSQVLAEWVGRVSAAGNTD